MVQQRPSLTQKKPQSPPAGGWLARWRQSDANVAPQPPRRPSADTPAAVQMQRGLLAWLNSAQAATAWGTLLLILGIAAAVYLHQVSQTAIVGRIIMGTQISLDQLRAANSLLRQEIATEQALETLEARAVALNRPYGRIELTTIEYLPVTVPPAVVAAPPAPPAPPPPIETIGEALRLFVRQNVTILARGAASDGR